VSSLHQDSGLGGPTREGQKASSQKPFSDDDPELTERFAVKLKDKMASIKPMAVKLLGSLGSAH
jgi:hypothetical protein